MVEFSRKLSAYLDQINRFLLFLTIVAMTVFITLQIIFRVFFTALSWTEELSRYLLVWSSFIGATVAFKKGAHISITFLLDIFSPRNRKILCTLSMLLMAIFFLVSIWYGFLLIKLQALQTSPAIGLKMRYIYTIIPVSFLTMLVHLWYEFLQLWFVKKTSEVRV